MALKDIFTMVKADRYTADGREELIKAQEAETEDRVYQNGEISQKTGLMKTPNGWVKPPKGKTAGKGAETKPAEWEETRMASGKIYDLPGKGKRIIERENWKTGEKTYALRDLNNLRAEDINFKSLDEATAFAEKHYSEGKSTESTSEQKSNNPISVGNVVKHKSGIPIKIKKVENYGGDKVIVGEYQYNGKTETNRFRMDELNTDAAPCVITADTKIRVRKA